MGLWVRAHHGAIAAGEAQTPRCGSETSRPGQAELLPTTRSSYSHSSCLFKQNQNLSNAAPAIDVQNTLVPAGKTHLAGLQPGHSPAGGVQTRITCLGGWKAVPLRGKKGKKGSCVSRQPPAFPLPCPHTASPSPPTPSRKQLLELRAPWHSWRQQVRLDLGARAASPHRAPLSDSSAHIGAQFQRKKT